MEMLHDIPPTDKEMVAAGYWLDADGYWVDAAIIKRAQVVAMLGFLRAILEADVPF